MTAMYLPRRMEAAVADGTAPSSVGGDSGRAAAADGVARGGQRRPRRGGRCGQRLQRRMEATMADGGGWMRSWRTETTVADGGGDVGIEPAAVVEVRSTDI